MKSALVTGAASGLGAAIARRLSREGYRVAIVDTDAAAARAQAAKLSAAVAFAADVTDEAAIEALLDAFGDIPDVLVNNAGIVRFGPILEHSVADFRKVIDVNLTGTFIVTRAGGAADGDARLRCDRQHHVAQRHRTESRRGRLPRRPKPPSRC
jgi:NAD(P)-dependent dehydrogenase (short-subunit alcohol dehydrogenase family)